MGEITRIGPVSFGKIQGVMGAIASMLLGFVNLLIGLVIGLVTGEYSVALGGLMLFIGGPIFSMIFGFLAGALLAWLYNITAGWVGGVEIDLEE